MFSTQHTCRLTEKPPTSTTPQNGLPTRSVPCTLGVCSLQSVVWYIHLIRGPSIRSEDRTLCVRERENLTKEFSLFGKSYTCTHTHTHAYTYSCLSPVSFELPYNIWCNGCGSHVGMGVRYNAEKTKVGNYYTTPIYKFRMKCHLCDSHFEIQTDPKVCVTVQMYVCVCTYS